MTTPINPPPQRVPESLGGLIGFVGLLTESVRLIFERVRHIDIAPVRDISGSGSPEGVESAPPGSTYRNTDGGAGVSFYVKESGTGNTGWVGK